MMRPVDRRIGRVQIIFLRIDRELAQHELLVVALDRALQRRREFAREIGQQHRIAALILVEQKRDHGACDHD
jgi:hypothetical protein